MYARAVGSAARSAVRSRMASQPIRGGDAHEVLPVCASTHGDHMRWRDDE